MIFDLQILLIMDSMYEDNKSKIILYECSHVCRCVLGSYINISVCVEVRSQTQMLFLMFCSSPF